MSEVRVIVVDRCCKCPYRGEADVVADGTADECRKKGAYFDWESGIKRGEFPKWCPLKKLMEG